MHLTKTRYIVYRVFLCHELPKFYMKLLQKKYCTVYGAVLQYFRKKICRSKAEYIAFFGKFWYTIA